MRVQITRRVQIARAVRPASRNGLSQNNRFEPSNRYMTQKYLTETDPILRRYDSCHCPWAREAIKHGDDRCRFAIHLPPEAQLP
jgi:hypothetical protein